MPIFTLIPVKKLSDGKRRLSPVLNAEEREDFALTMLKDVLGAVSSSHVGRTVLICSDTAVQQLSSNYRTTFLPDTGDELNKILEYATNWCIRNGAEAILTLPADVPLLRAGDIDRLVSLCLDKPSVAISPSYNGGTNALLRNPPDVIPACFGAKSFKKHLSEASRIGIKARIYRSTRLSMDIDSPQDLARFLKLGEGLESHRFLKRNKIDRRLRKLFP